MRKLVIGAIIGVVIGVVLGSTVIAPRIKLPGDREEAKSEGYHLKVRKNKTSTKNIASPIAEKQKIHWRMATPYSRNLPQLGELGSRLEKTVFQLSGGHLHLKLHEPGTLVSNDQILDAVRSNTIEAAFGALTFWTKKNIAFQLYSSVPFGPPLHEYLSWLYGGGGHKILEKLYQREGLHGMVCGGITTEGSGWFRKPVENLKTFQTLRMGMSGLGGMVVRKLGAHIVELDENHVFEALDNNIIDAAEASQPAVDISLGLQRVAKHYYFPGWHQPATLLHLIINADSWQNLPKSKQAQVKAACAGNISHGLALSHSLQFNALKELTKQGVHIHTWSPEIILAFQEAWENLQNELTKGSPEFKLVWKSLQAFREEYAIWQEISLGTPLQ